ncbi:MAG: homoserine dehydrogenase [Alphaproteobacteria bacterium]
MTAPLRVGIAGLGTVGAAVIRIIERRRAALAEAVGRPIEVVAVTARSKKRDRGVDLSAMRWVADAQTLATDPGIDVFVELMGGAGDPAKSAVEAALGAGKAVVTANKALLAAHGPQLARRAEKKGVALNFEAAVAGGIPVIKTLREGLVGNSIERVYGILNGTCNYILTRMADEGLAFETCLADAQRLGYAEADPSFDVDGYDTAHKLSLLTSLAFGTLVDTKGISVEGIRSIKPVDLKMADELGFRVKLLGVAQRTALGVEQRVHPTFVPKESAIAQVNGVLNAVAIDADAVDLTLVGPGAGGDATASAVVADIADVARRHRTAPFIRPVASLTKPTRAPMTSHEGGYYIRLEVTDKKGTAAQIASRMAQNAISLESIVQRRDGPTRGGTVPSAAEAAPVVLITYATTEAAVRRALKQMDTDGVLLGRPQVIRIERS